MSWQIKEELRRRLQRESGYFNLPRGGRTPFALIYPNEYRVGMSNLGLHVVYSLLNRRGDTACERFFLPERDMLSRYQKTNTPLLSLETQTPLHAFPLIGFALSFELDYFHVLTILELGKVEKLAAKKGERDPLVIAGGPCATFNPEPLADFFDAFIIGEGEAILPQFMAAYHEAKAQGLSRLKTLASLAKVPGVYVPSQYEPVYMASGALQTIRPLGEAPAKVRRQWVQDFDAEVAHTAIVTEDAEFNLYLLETARGCGRHCRFCMAGYAFRRPRVHSLAKLAEAVATAKSYGKRLGLMGAAISDYPDIDRLCALILDEGLAMSVASLRADSVTPSMVEALAGCGLKTLTIAPEAGSVRLRAVINKGITAEHVFQAVDLGLMAGIINFRLYIMVGLPWEEEEDWAAIVQLAEAVRERMNSGGSKGLLTLSVNPFVPKPFTPFQWLPMAEKSRTAAALRYLQQGLKKMPRLKIIAEAPKAALVQGILARGDRRLGKAILAAHGQGGAKKLTAAMKDSELATEFYLYRRREEDEVFPWDIIDIGVKRDYLYAELDRAAKFLPTSPCFEGCRRCGVC
ncbi:MAG: radical SAM protein [Selenomonadaceae bacterium]|nr:radical SAM protein [Selenomonadaceae bacterium]